MRTPSSEPRPLCRVASGNSTLGAEASASCRGSSWAASWQTKEGAPTSGAVGAPWSSPQPRRGGEGQTLAVLLHEEMSHAVRLHRLLDDGEQGLQALLEGGEVGALPERLGGERVELAQEALLALAVLQGVARVALHHPVHGGLEALEQPLVVLRGGLLLRGAPPSCWR